MESSIQRLARLIREFPDLPVVPMVDAEVCVDEDYGRWMGSIGRVEIKTYAISEFSGQVIYYDDEDDRNEFIDDLIDKYGKKVAADMEEWAWTTAIVVNIDTAD